MIKRKMSPKVVICGTGFIGQTLTRLTHAKGWEIVAAYNRSGDKVGKDLGTLAGLESPLGVTVQDCEAIDTASLEADIALVATTDFLDQNYRFYEQFLKAGINVLCHGGESYHPRLINTAIAEKIDALAKAYGVTFTGSGIWDMTRIWSGIILAGPCVEIQALEHRSQTEIARQGVQFLDMIGVGLSEKAFDEKIGRKAQPASNTVQIPSVFVLQHYGYTITNVNTRQEPVIWDEPVYCREMGIEIPAGDCVGLRVLVEVATQEGVKATTSLEWRVFREAEEELMHWKVLGKPRMEITVKREDSGVASASSLFNRIPDVLAAEPGIVEIVNYGPEKPSVQTSK